MLTLLVGDVRCCNCGRKSVAESTQAKLANRLCPGSPTSGHEYLCAPKSMYKKVYSSLIHNHLQQKTTQMSINS